MPFNCIINLGNSPHSIFYAGQPLCGSVHIHLLEDRKFRNIYLELRGKAHTERQSGKQTYTKNQKLLDTRIYLMGNGKGDSCK